MELVGITGKSGSGKTTFSNMLAQNSEIGVIHVDNILKDIKLKYFKFLMKENVHGEKTKVDSGLKTMLYKNKILFNIFMRFRAKLIEKPLTTEINNLKSDRKKIILIDDIFLQHLTCYKDLSLLFLIERPFIDRRISLMERDGLTKEEVVAYDIAHFTGNYKEISHNRKTIKIINNDSKENLNIIAEKIYKKHFVSFKNKYKVKNLKVRNHELVPEITTAKFKNFTR